MLASQKIKIGYWQTTPIIYLTLKVCTGQNEKYVKSAYNTEGVTKMWGYPNQYCICDIQ